jgi:hypothetical protein
MPAAASSGNPIDVCFCTSACKVEGADRGSGSDLGCRLFLHKTQRKPLSPDFETKAPFASSSNKSPSIFAKKFRSSSCAGRLLQFGTTCLVSLSEPAPVELSQRPTCQSSFSPATGSSRPSTIQLAGSPRAALADTHRTIQQGKRGHSARIFIWGLYCVQGGRVRRLE